MQQVVQRADLPLKDINMESSHEGLEARAHSFKFFGSDLYVNHSSFVWICQFLLEEDLS